MYIKVDGYNIEYKVTGEGDNIAVIIQGWGTKLAVYDSIAKLLSEKFKVITFDLPGFGGSEEPKEPWNIDRYGEFFCHFMQAFSVKRAVLIGHSYGGRIIIKLAGKIDLPFEVDRIVLIDSGGFMP